MRCRAQPKTKTTTMKTIRLLVFAGILLLSAMATRAQGNRVGVINSEVFYDQKAGIVRLNKAIDALNAEFKSKADALNAKETRLLKLSDELRNYTGADRERKVEEAQKLQRDANFEREDLKSRYQRREEVLLTPIRQDIGNALNEFAKQKGFTALFDISKDTTGFLLWVDQASVESTTSEFVRFYNARPVK
jgi:Skp family chaperone for outer membrane proteins